MIFILNSLNKTNNLSGYIPCYYFLTSSQVKTNTDLDVS